MSSVKSAKTVAEIRSIFTAICNPRGNWFVLKREVGIRFIEYKKGINNLVKAAFKYISFITVYIDIFNSYNEIVFAPRLNCSRAARLDMSELEVKINIKSFSSIDIYRELLSSVFSSNQSRRVLKVSSFIRS